jgi:putative transposase
MLGRSHPSSGSRVVEQMARNVTMGDAGFLINRRYLLHDRDSKYGSSFRQVMEAGSVQTLALPPRSPNLNAYAERWVRSVRLPERRRPR